MSKNNNGFDPRPTSTPVDNDMEAMKQKAAQAAKTKQEQSTQSSQPQKSVTVGEQEAQSVENPMQSLAIAKKESSEAMVAVVQRTKEGTIQVAEAMGAQMPVIFTAHYLQKEAEGMREVDNLLNKRYEALEQVVANFTKPSTGLGETTSLPMFSENMLTDW